MDFEPKMLLGDKLKSQISLAYTAEQKLLFKTLADYIFKEVTSVLIESTKIGSADSVEVNLDINNLAKRYSFNTDIYNEIGVKQELIKLAEEKKLKVYQYTPKIIVITF